MKKTISILLCAVMLVSLAACGERKRPEEPPSAPVETDVRGNTIDYRIIDGDLPK